MGKYTYNKKYDKEIEKQLEIVKYILIKETKPISIVLFGGFGKGEGMVDKNGKPLNDFDIYIIGRKRLSDEECDRLSVKCSTALGRGGLDFVEHADEEYDEDRFFHVDIRFINYDKISKLLPTQRTFELKNSSQIIYGEDIFNKIPDIKIPDSDAIRILFNKMDHLLLCENKSNKKIKMIYIMKSYLDLCSALLIYKGDFYGYYTKRNEVFKKTDFSEDLKKKIDWANNFRRNPDFDRYDIKKEWSEAKYWAGYALKHIIHGKFNCGDDWGSIAKTVYYKLPYSYFNPYLKSRYLFFGQYYLTLKYILKCWERGNFIVKPLFSWRDFGLRIAVPLFLYLNDEEKLAEKYLKKLTFKTEPLRNKILNLYGGYYLQKLI